MISFMVLQYLTFIHFILLLLSNNSDMINDTIFKGLEIEE